MVRDAPEEQCHGSSPPRAAPPRRLRLTRGLPSRERRRITQHLQQALPDLAIGECVVVVVSLSRWGLTDPIIEDLAVLQWAHPKRIVRGTGSTRPLAADLGTRGRVVLGVR